MSDERSLARFDREDPDGFLNARSDPASAAFGTLGSEAGSDLNWFLLLRQRVQDRAAASSRYPWWVLWSLLAGLFALNFTVFIVALPSVGTELHTSVTVLTWTMVGPLLAADSLTPIRVRHCSRRFTRPSSSGRAWERRDSSPRCSTVRSHVVVPRRRRSSAGSLEAYD